MRLSERHPKAAAQLSPPSRLATFRLVDQFGREIEDEEYDGNPLIIVAGNREGARGVALWTAAIRAVIGEMGVTHVLPVADLGGVPRLVRGMVARLLPRDRAHWCALDWDGQIAAPVRCGHGPLVAAAYDARRQLRQWCALPLDTVESKLLVALVEGDVGR